MNERLSLSYGRIAEIPGEKAAAEPFCGYFEKVASFLLSVKKETDNRVLYEDILRENYASSYANPDYAAEKLGTAMGPVLAAVYAELRGIIPAVFEEDEEGTAVLYELFLEIYGAFEEGEVPPADYVKEIFRSYVMDYLPDFTEKRQAEQVDAKASFALDIIMQSDLTDLSYLYNFGEYISDDIRGTAQYLNSLPEETIKEMADVWTEGYRLGFLRENKDLSRKKTVQIIYRLGFERVIREAVLNFRKMGLEPTIPRAAYRLSTKTLGRLSGYAGEIPNQQFDYDHREDIAIFLDENYSTKKLRALREAFEKVKELAAAHAGPAVLETFGQEPFSPERKSCAYSLKDGQQELYVKMRSGAVQITKRYIPPEERSFTIIDFPVPSVGRRYGEIFRDTIRINTLDANKYLAIQQKLIDALDQGTKVRILGKNGNRTNLTVSLHPLENPKTQTIFENCGADVNIPVGEVFTSPKLEGTNGLLHVKRVFLEGYEFRDLSISLTEGMISDYSCGNFENPAEGRKYIEENILFHHKTLPIGEFAIGTNTLAYVMARKYGIEAKMPILIAEKTGPHFAVGDTCYSWNEDKPTYNPDGKEAIARDNSVTLKRKEKPSEAYFGCHTDITIPYDELGEIAAVCPDGSEKILLRDGRFVLPGTEELNKAFEE
ncbi:MAG TPA: aminopeptidase [Lachnospiraceae bacterium]|nr:aminopeptidase [Lachnospiraceae bacterium]